MPTAPSNGDRQVSSNPGPPNRSDRLPTMGKLNLMLTR